MAEIIVKRYKVCTMDNTFWKRVQASLVDYLGAKNVHREIDRNSNLDIYHLNTGVTLAYRGLDFLDLYGSEEEVWRTKFTIEDKTGIKLEEIVN